MLVHEHLSLFNVRCVRILFVRLCLLIMSEFYDVEVYSVHGGGLEHSMLFKLNGLFKED